MTQHSNIKWEQLRDRLAAQFGLYIDESRQKQGDTAVAHRARVLGLTVPAYYELLFTRAGTAELRNLAEQLANHETQFLRNPAHYRALREYVFPTLQRSRPPLQPIRCWSAGCSTGEEPYSIALVALQVFGWPLSRPVEIWGTDLSQQVLDVARRGEYRGRTLANISADYKRWFEPQENGGLSVSAVVRSLVQFEQHNLLDPWPSWAAQLDVVFCQNVTIYFQLSTCQRLVERIYHALNDGGYLFLGFSESLWGVFDGFETVEVDGAFIYRKGAQRRPQRQQRPAQSARPEKPASTFNWPIRRVQRSEPAPRRAEPPRSILEQAQQLRSTGQQRAALDLLNRAPYHERTPALLALTAQLHADLGEHEQAAAEARRALELDVMQETAYFVLGVLEVQNGAWAEGARLLERALYLIPESPTVSFYLAESYRQLGRTAAAQREYRNTVRKLSDIDPTALVDGVAAAWLIETCQRWLELLEKDHRG